MNHPIEKAGYILCFILAGIISLSSFMKPLDTPAPVPASLHVPFIPQLGNTWCWAAVTEMVMKFYHDNIDHTAPSPTQCELVRMSYGKGCTLQCPVTDTVPSKWDNGGGFPFDPSYGYSDSSTPGHPLQGALNWDELCDQIRDSCPVIFQWKWKGITRSTRGNSDTHWMVAEGCPHSSYDTTHGWISMHDPFPVGTGRHRIISYAEYANLKPVSYPGYTNYVFNTHGVDYFKFAYKGDQK